MAVMGHPNLERLKQGLAAFAARDMATLRELFHEGVEWHYEGTSILAGTYHGLDEVFELFARRAALSENTYRLEVEHAIANDEFVTILGRTHAQRGSDKYEDAICLIYRVDEGVVVEAWALPGHPSREKKFYG
jgi:ketosteroid isomerase-like protein